MITSLSGTQTSWRGTLFHGLGNSTLAAVDEGTGHVDASFSYAPFGEVLEATDGGGSEGLETHKRNFNDKYQDDVSGLSYYGARYYDKTAILWTQSDPFYRIAPEGAGTEPRRAQLYSFELNNPLRYVDPDGRDASGPWIVDEVRIPNASERGRFDWEVSHGGSDTYDRFESDDAELAFIMKYFNVHPATDVYVRSQIVAGGCCLTDGYATYAEVDLNNEQPSLFFTGSMWTDLLGPVPLSSGGIYIAKSIVESDDPLAAIKTLLIVVHEGVHAEQESRHADMNEAPARAATFEVLQKLLDSEFITLDEFNTLTKWLQGYYIWRGDNAHVCPACWGFSNPSLSDEIFQGKMTDYYQGPWGVSANPSGPAATH